MDWLRKPLVALASLLLVLLVFGILRVPESFLATALSTFLVLVLPGLFLSDLIFRQPLHWPSRLVLAFALSVGLWLIPAAATLWFHGSLTVVIGVMLGVTLLLAAVTLLRPQRSHTTTHRGTGISRDWTSLVYWVALAVSLVLILVTSASTSAPYFTDRTAEQAFIRHFLDSDQFLTEGFRISPALVEVTARDFTHGWGVLLAMVIRLAQVEMLDAYVYHLPLILMVLSLLAFYALASELFESRIAVLSACLVLVLYIFSDIVVHEGIGRSFFMRIMQDKFAMRFILLPIALWLTLRYIKRGERAFLISLSIVIIALALVHPLGAAIYSISFGLFLLIRLLPGSWSQKKAILIQAIPIIIVVLVMLLIPLAERLLMTTYDSADRFLGNVEENLDDLRARRVLSLGGGFGLFISQPELIAHPLVLLAIFLTPFLLRYVRTRPSAQFLFANMAGVLLLCYTPVLTSVLGMLVTPWLVWRVLWLLPVSLVIGFFLGEATRLLTDRFGLISPQRLQLIPLGLILVGALLFRGKIDDGLDYLLERRDQGSLTAEQRVLFTYLREHGMPGSIILTPNSRLDNEIPGLVGHSYGLTFRMAPALIESASDDRKRFYEASLVTDDHLQILQEHNINYIILETGTELAGQFKGLPGMFRLLYFNEALELYEAAPGLVPNATIIGNTHLLRGETDQALASYREALDLDSGNALAHLGLAEVYRAQGDAEQALSEYRRAVLAHPEVLVPQTIDKLSQFLHIDSVYLLPFLARGEHYRTGPDADLEDSNWAIYSFLDHLDSAHIPSDSRDLVHVDVFLIEGQPRGVLFQHPPSQIAFRVGIPPAARLRFSPALAPDVWQLGKGDGVQFDIYLDDGEAKWQLFSTYLDPKNVPSQRQWHDHGVDLSRWAGQTVTIVFATGPGPNGDDRYDWAGWGEPRIVQPVTVNFETEHLGAEEEQGFQDNLTIDYERRTVILQQPSSRLVFRVDVPKGASLYFGLGMDPSGWSSQEGDGLEYSIYVRNVDEPTVLHRAFHRYIDPKNNPEDRHWLDKVVDLSAYAGQTVDIIFEGLPDPHDGAYSGLGGWSTPVLVGEPLD